MTPELEKAFWLIHKGLPRQAPGSDTSTQKLLELAKIHETAKTALDIGCGPGRSSLILAKNGFSVTAIDTSDLLLEELRNSAKSNSLGNSIKSENVSMFNMPYDNSSFDVVWAEGAAYIAGWENAIKDWQKLLKPDGTMILTECCWLTDEPSSETKKFWSEGYSAMMTVNEAAKQAQQRGLVVEHTYTLPDQDWWDEYYTLIEERLAKYQGSKDGALQEMIEAEKLEIELRRNYPSEYGYVGSILKKK